MTDEAMTKFGKDDDDWVIPPPAPGSYTLAVRPGDGVELSQAALDALDVLARELGDEDVSAFMLNAGCRRYSDCMDGACQPKVSRPCYSLVTCAVCLVSP